MTDGKGISKSRKTDEALVRAPRSMSGPLADTPTTEDDGGESAIAGRSREHHPGVPEEIENLNEPPKDSDETAAR